MSAQTSLPPVIPLPASIEMRPGTFWLSPSATIVAGKSEQHIAEMLISWLRPATGFELPLSRRGAIELHLDKKLENLGEEGYRLEVGLDKVSIRAHGQAGLFYGCETLRQLLPPDIFRRAHTAKNWSIPCVVIEDKPRFGWRGGMIDTSRHFMPKEFIFKFIDLLAMYKLNVFHIHLTDDTGWRIEIKKYPRLTQVGSTMDFSSMNPKEATRSINQHPGGFYTQDDIREIVQYASDRFITVVPEIEMPGHSNAAIFAYPELGNRDQIKAGGGDTAFLGAYDNVYNVDDSTIAFLENVLDEVMDLFPSKFIHIGGDEVWKEPWKHNPKAQARMRAQGLKNEEELQSWFVHQMDTYLASKGRRLLGWDEILEGGLAPGATVMSWRGFEGGIAAAKAGHDVVMAPTNNTYFDYLQSRITANEPKGIGGYLPLETVYQFEPVAKELTPEEGKHVLGGQAQLWAEFIPHPRHMEYMGFPRFCALAETVWSPKESRNYDNFLARLQGNLEALKILDVNFRPLGSDPKPVAQWKSGEVSEKASAHEWDLGDSLKESGDYKVIFQYTHGADRLDIGWVEILADGVVVQRVEHHGMTGSQSKDNVYLVSLRGVRAGARYRLRASVSCDGGSDSNGDIFVVHP